MPGTRNVVVVALAAVFSLAVFQAGSVSRRSLPAPVVATISVANVINGLEEIEARQNQLKTFIAERTSKIDGLTRDFETAKAEFDLLPKSGDARRQKAEVLERLRMQIRFESELADALINNRRGEIFAGLFEKIDSAVAELAQSRGYTLVLTNDEETAMPANPTEQQARGAIYSRRVMYADQAVDITDELVTLMNNNWQIGQGN